MAESSDSVSIDIERISIGGKEHLIQTSYGSLFVSVYGDQEKHALVTYPDVALNYMSCFQGLFFCPEASSLLLHNFCIYHISPPGHELGAGPISSDAPVPSAHELADQIVDVLDFFGLGSVMCMGVTAGAYILMLFVTRYRERVLGLILISPLCRTPSWTDWLYNQVMLNMLYYYGMCSLIKEFLLQRYFSKEVRGGPQVLESDIVQACRTVGRRGEGPHFAARSRLTSTGRNSRTDWCWTGSIVVCSLGSVYLAWAELQGVGLVLNPELLLVFDVLLTAALLLPSTVSCCVFLVGAVVVFVFLFLVYTCFGRLV